ncbi:MAG: zinc-ribbon domain-containing protein [Porcipelethomonas sp.]
MDLWDKVKNVANDAANALNDAARDVSTGAKEMSEKSRLKRAIKNEEQKISNCYRTIGEKFFNENSAAPAGYEEQFNNIRNSNAEIQRLQGELSAIENSAKCPKCGARVTPDQRFCQSCGNSL